MSITFRAAVLAASATFLLSACSKPIDTVIPASQATWETDLYPNVKKLDETDRALVAKYIMRKKVAEFVSGASSAIPPGTTLAQAIDDQRAFDLEELKKQQAALELKQKLEAERAAARAEIEKAVVVTLLEKTELPKNYEAGRYSEMQLFKVGVKNTGNQPLVGIAGTLEFIDVFDKKVGEVGFKISETIAPGQDYVWDGQRPYNEFINEQRAVWNLEEGKYKTRFVPETLVYANGTKLSVE